MLRARLRSGASLRVVPAALVSLARRALCASSSALHSSRDGSAVGGPASFALPELGPDLSSDESSSSELDEHAVGSTRNSSSSSGNSSGSSSSSGGGVGGGGSGKSRSKSTVLGRSGAGGGGGGGGGGGAASRAVSEDGELGVNFDDILSFLPDATLDAKQVGPPRVREIAALVERLYTASREAAAGSLSASADSPAEANAAGALAGSAGGAPDATASLSSNDAVQTIDDATAELLLSETDSAPRASSGSMHIGAGGATGGARKTGTTTASPGHAGGAQGGAQAGVTTCAGLVYRQFSSERVVRPVQCARVLPRLSPSFVGAKGFDQVPVRLDSEPVPSPLQVRVPRLAHGLERVLHERGVHPLMSLSGPQSYHFDPALRHLPDLSEVNESSFAPFRPPSMDTVLHSVAKQTQSKLCASTSSITSMLASFYCALTNFREVDVSMLSSIFQYQPRTLGLGIVKPQAFLLRSTGDGMYALDGDTQPRNPQNAVLIQLGKPLEALMTKTITEFRDSVLSTQQFDSQSHGSEAFHYQRVGAFLLRSQLDCWDDRLPGPFKAFDIKTRATAAIRQDVRNYPLYLDYRITRLKGVIGSFEREFFDMIRSAFLKYSYQVRIGRMAGIFVAYHNIKELFGFEYIPLADMDASVSGNTETAQRLYETSLALSEAVLLRVLADVGGQVPSLRLLFTATAGTEPFVDVFCEEIRNPAPWPQPCGMDESLYTAFNKPRKQLENIGPVHKYRVHLKRFLNGNPVVGTLAPFTPRDSFFVLQNIEHLWSGAWPHQTAEFARVLVQSRDAPPEADVVDT